MTHERMKSSILINIHLHKHNHAVTCQKVLSSPVAICKTMPYTQKMPLKS